MGWRNGEDRDFFLPDLTEQQSQGRESRDPDQGKPRRPAVVTSGKTGQFEVIAHGEKIAERGGNWFTRSFGAGYPDLDQVVELLDERHAKAKG